tara:strand:- start:654 stop:1022 length:369 start_codon:yes stop_codon:yes gene_type:complete
MGAEGKYITKRRKKHARNSRKYSHHVEGQSPGSKSTHLMVDDTRSSDGSPRKSDSYHVWASVATSKAGYKKQTPDEAYEKGEMYKFKNRKKAEKFAYGGWKKGKDRREAMKFYRHNRVKKNK